VWTPTGWSERFCAGLTRGSRTGSTPPGFSNGANEPRHADSHHAQRGTQGHPRSRLVGISHESPRLLASRQTRTQVRVVTIPLSPGRAVPTLSRLITVFLLQSRAMARDAGCLPPIPVTPHLPPARASYGPRSSHPPRARRAFGVAYRDTRRSRPRVQLWTFSAGG